MEKLNMSYETLFIVDLSVGEEGVKALVEKFKSLISENGEIKNIAEWGKRRLAYPINDLNEGYYVLINFDAPASFPSELERIFNITDGILRSMVIRSEVPFKADAKAPEVVLPYYDDDAPRAPRSRREAPKAEEVKAEETAAEETAAEEASAEAPVEAAPEA